MKLANLGKRTKQVRITRKSNIFVVEIDNYMWTFGKDMNIISSPKNSFMDNLAKEALNRWIENATPNY